MAKTAMTDEALVLESELDKISEFFKKKPESRTEPRLTTEDKKVVKKIAPEGTEESI